MTEPAGPTQRRDRADVEALAFDEAFAELQRVVAALEAGGRLARGDDRACTSGRSRSSAAARACSPRPSSASSS